MLVLKFVQIFKYIYKFFLRIDKKFIIYGNVDKLWTILTSYYNFVGI